MFSTLSLSLSYSLVEIELIAKKLCYWLTQIIMLIILDTLGTA